jgi:hypothetical protein
MRKINLLVFLLAIPAIIFAQSTSISGIIYGGSGQVIRLIAYDDFISQKVVTLGSVEIGNDSSFTLEFDLKETRQAFLDINYQRSEIFVKPGESYQLEVKYDEADQLVSYFDQRDLAYRFIDSDSTELNRLIWKFNGIYNRFIDENFDQIYVLHDRSRVNSFREDVAVRFPDINDGYFRDYITYKLADVEQFARLKSKTGLGEAYFTDKPVLYDNVEYTFFFNDFFEKFLVTSPSVITISDLIIAINDEGSIEAIDTAIAKLPYMKDENFRELVMIHGLKGLAYNGVFKKPRVLEIIREIGRNTTDPIHKKICDNLEVTITRLTPGHPAPDLNLISIAGMDFKLKNIKGKPILLNFFRSAQPGTQASFDQLAELFNVYRSGLEVISISIDNDPEAYLKLANSGNYQWTFAHFGNDPNVYDLYNIRNLPLYVLIDVEGNIAACPAPPPGDKLERAVMKVVH